MHQQQVSQRIDKKSSRLTEPVNLKHAVWLGDGNDHEARVCDDAIIPRLSLKVKYFGS